MGPHGPALGGVLENLALGGVVLDDQQALARQGRRRDLPLCAGLLGGQSKLNGEMESRTLAGFAFDPDSARHEFDQAFTDRQAQTGTAEMTSGRGIHLAERLEEAVLLVGGDAQAGVADADVQGCRGSREGLARFMAADGGLGAFAGDVDGDLAPFGELHRVADQVDHDLTQTRDIPHEGIRHVLGDRSDKPLPVTAPVLADISCAMAKQKVLRSMVNKSARPYFAPAAA